MDGLVLAAGGCALLAGGLGARAYVARCDAQNRLRRKKAAAGAGGVDAQQFAAGGMAAKVLAYAVAQTIADREVPREADGFAGRLEERAARTLRFAGLGDRSPQVWFRVGAGIALRLGAAGVVFGLVIGVQMAVFLGLVCAVLGLYAPWWAAKKEAQARGEALAEQLPEMLEVVCLGLRSGLSFERSFALYPAYFRTALAQECAAASRRWESGLSTRDEALLELARGYDSVLLLRTLQGVNQALRLGTALEDNLQQAADEARKQYRAQKEEAVARAPIKMMGPIGVLILPAMLLLVLGPVLLELISGF